ncbi:MAG TPA: ATP-binding protein [Bacteroidales bacterium]|nr:ATP-binding protein [Bacteroidales bacterium]
MKNLTTSKLAYISIIAGLGALFFSCFLIITAYFLSIDAAEQGLYKYYSNKALFLTTLAETNPDLSDSAVLQLISKSYQHLGKKPDDEYICIVNDKGDLLLHSANPVTMGNYAGSNILPSLHEGKGTLADLVKSRQSYTGYYVSSNGQKQIAAFDYLPKRNWIIGVHRSRAELREGVKEHYKWLILAFVFISGIIIPATLILLFQVYRITHRREMKIEKVSRELLEAKNKELKGAKDRAEESDRLKSAFLANISHEIRTPMNSIIGFSELLQNPDLTSEKRLYYATILKDNSNRLLSLVNDVLDISRIETGQVRLNFETVYPHEVIDKLVKNYNERMIAKGLKLEINNEKGTNGQNLVTDSLKLYQILNNLLSNALRFTEKGSITISYGFSNGICNFCVRDTGIGIPKESISKIFERFYQVEDKMTRNEGGTGIGLSIVKKLVQMLGGEIWIESKPAEGSAFIFTLPCLPPNRKEINVVTAEKI